MWCEIEVVHRARGINGAYWAVILWIKQVLQRMADGHFRGFFRLMDAHFFYFFLLVDNDAKAQRAALLCPCVWMFLLRTFWSVFVYPCTIQPQNINLYGGQSIWAQSTFQLSVEGWGGGGMWGNVFRQTAGRLGQRTVHKTTPNLILEPKTGSIYIQNREWQKAALSETSDSHLPH